MGDMVHRTDPDAIHLKLSRLDPEIEVSWPDIGMSLQGHGQMAEHMVQRARCIPDWEIRVADVVMDGPSTVRVMMTFSGTQVHMLFPIFPIGRRVSWQSYAWKTFNQEGKLLSARVQLLLPLERSALGSNMLAGLSQSVITLASTASGSRMLQAAMDMLTPAEHCTLMVQMRGQAWDAAAGLHANHVLQKFIIVAPPSRVQFIIAEFEGRAVQAAQHKTRSRILERLIEHCPHQQTAGLMDELIRHSLPLSKHRFANFVVQQILEHGAPDQRRRVAERLMPELHKLAKHSHAGKVVCRALAFCDAETRERMAQVLEEDIGGLARHAYGSFVVRELKHMAKVGTEALA